MKTLLRTVLIAWAALFAVGASSSLFAVDWKVFGCGEDNHQEFWNFYDKESTYSVTNGNVRVWCKLVNTSELQETLTKHGNDLAQKVQTRISGYSPPKDGKNGAAMSDLVSKFQNDSKFKAMAEQLQNGVKFSPEDFAYLQSLYTSLSYRDRVTLATITGYSIMLEEEANYSSNAKAKFLVEIDCGQRKMQFLSGTANLNGKRENSSGASPWTYIDPENTFDSLRRMVCH